MTKISQRNDAFPETASITRTGGLLRRISVDELPQLLNVLRGEMSLIGPRPTLPYQVKRYDSRQWCRLSVPPGLTGLAQVNGRNRMTWPERIEWDLRYVENLSLRLTYPSWPARPGRCRPATGSPATRARTPLRE